MIYNTKYWLGHGTNSNLIHCRLECKMVQTLLRTVWHLKKKTGLNVYLPYGPEIPSLPKNTCTGMFIAALPIITPNWKQAKCPSTGEQINNML